MAPLANSVLTFPSKLLHPRTSHMCDRVRGLVAETRITVTNTLMSLMNGLFETVDDTLYGLADRAKSSRAQTKYFDAMRVLRYQRNEIQEKFTAGVLANFDAFWRDGPSDLSLSPPQKSHSSGLALLDEDILEATLAITDLVSKGENRFQREIYRLNLRFSLALCDVEVDAKSNPLAPTGICVPFHTALQNLTLDSQVRLVLYKLFDKQFIQHIGSLYGEINRIFREDGADLTTTRIITRKHDSVSPAEDNKNYAVPHNNPTAKPSQAFTFHTLQSLLQERRGLNNNNKTRDTTAIVNNAELLHALSALQHGIESTDQNNTAEDLYLKITQHLLLNSNGERQRTLSSIDQNILDLISMLFDFILMDQRLPDALKAIIARLQIPFIKVAIIDTTFFNENLHPARRLLNTLARAAAAWSDDRDRSPESLYGHIFSIVQKVIATFETDPEVFDRLEKEFSAYLEREQRGAEITEQRTNQIVRGKEQLRQGRERVASEIATRINSFKQQVPLVVRVLLEEGWKDVLLLTYLRQGDNSLIWQEQLAVADKLLWSVQPKVNHEERQSLLRAIPDLLYQLREGLNGISYDQHRMMRLIEELQSCHLACLRGTEYFQIPPALLNKDTPKQTHTIDHAGELKGTTSPPLESSDAEQLIGLVRELAVGTWLDVTESDERQLRVKLSWKSDVSDTYVFVNRKGVKVLEMTTNGVLRLLRNGHARLLRDMDTPIVDRAVEALFAHLQK